MFDSIKKSLILSVNGQQELAATKNEGEQDDRKRTGKTNPKDARQNLRVD
jgi:hypothetical protein